MTGPGIGPGPNPAPDFGSLPLYIDPVKGVRAWDVDPQTGELRSLYYPNTWTGDENAAECGFGMLGIAIGTGGYRLPIRIAEARLDNHDMSSCNHGFYAYFDGSRNYRAPHRVEGVIEGYGETTIGSKGFRCMKARIVALTVPATRTTPLPKRWGVRGWLLRRFHKVAGPAASSGSNAVGTFANSLWRFDVDVAHARLTLLPLAGTILAQAAVLVLALCHVIGSPWALVAPALWLVWYGWKWLCGRARNEYRAWRNHPSTVLPSIDMDGVADKVRARYPAIPLYDTFEQMVAAHPIGVPEAYMGDGGGDS